MLNIDGPAIIYLDKRKAMRKLRLRILCLTPIVLAIFAVTRLPPHPLPLEGITLFLDWILLLELPVLYFLISRNFARQTRPILSVSSMGITIDMLANRVGYLPWEEIKDVYSYRIGERLIGITLKDPRKVYARLGLKRSFVLRMNALVAPLYKPFGIRVAPITFSAIYLPISVDELLEQIKLHRPLYS